MLAERGTGQGWVNRAGGQQPVVHACRQPLDLWGRDAGGGPGESACMVHRGDCGTETQQQTRNYSADQQKPLFTAVTLIAG